MRQALERMVNEVESLRLDAVTVHHVLTAALQSGKPRLIEGEREVLEKGLESMGIALKELHRLYQAV